MKQGPGVLLVAVILLVLIVGGLVASLLVEKSLQNSIYDRWWGLPSVVIALLLLIGYVMWQDRDEFK